MQVLLIMAVLGTLAAVDLAPAAPASHAALRCVLAVLCMAVPPLAAAAIAWPTARAIRAGAQPRGRVLRRYGRLRAVHTGIWLASAAAVAVGLRWPQVVRFNWGLDGWLLVDELLTLLPVLVPLAVSWAAFYEVDRAIRLANAGGESDPPAPRIWSRREYLSFQLRTHAGIVLVPLAVLLVTQDVAQLAAPAFAAGPYGWTVFLIPLAALVLGFPLLLAFVWRTEPLADGPLRSRLEQAAGRWGLRVRGIYLWRTEGMVVNAAVAGFLPGLRYVFLSDALVENLDDDEIEAVFGHEVGHIRHHHVFLRAMVLLIPVSLLALARGFLGERLVSWEATLMTAVWPAALAGLSLAAGMGLYMALAFGFVSRRLERQADVFGCRVISSSREAAAEQGVLTAAGIGVFVSALEKLAVLNGVARHSPSWQHGSIARRVAFLESVAVDPQQEAALARQVRLLGSLVVGIVFAGLALPLVW